MTTDPGGPLSDAEVRQLVQLLARFATHDLDQFENWQLQSTYGPVYMVISRAPLPGWPDVAFTPIWPLPRRTDSSAGDEHGASGE